MKHRKLALAIALGAALIVAPGAVRLAAQDNGGTDTGVVGGRFTTETRFGDTHAPALRELLDAMREPEQQQVRIEQRVIIRIAPAPQRQQSEFLPDEMSEDAEPTFREDPYTSDCIAVNSIAGAAPAGGNRLLLFLRNRDVVSAQLEPSCAATAFYQGFYVERNEDGRLCVSRDRLLSRAGGRCMIEGFTKISSSED